MCTEAASPVLQAEHFGAAGQLLELGGKALEGSLGLGGEKLYYGMAPAKPCTAKGGINLCGLEAVPCQMPAPLGAPDTLLLHLKTKARIAHSKELHTIPCNGGAPLGSVKLICVRGHNEERLQDRSLGAAELELREHMLRFVDEARIETAWLPIQLKPERVSAMHNFRHSWKGRTVRIRMPRSCEAGAKRPSRVTRPPLWSSWQSACSGNPFRCYDIPGLADHGHLSKKAEKQKVLAVVKPACINCKLMRLGLLPMCEGWTHSGRPHRRAPIFKVSGKGVLCFWPSEASNLEGRPTISYHQGALQMILGAP